MLLASVEDATSRLAVDTERSFLATLGGACDLPVGALATVRAGDDGRPTIELDALVATLDGGKLVRATLDGRDPVVLGEEMASYLLDGCGARSFLEP